MSQPNPRKYLGLTIVFAILAAMLGTSFCYLEAEGKVPPPEQWFPEGMGTDLPNGGWNAMPPRPSDQVTSNSADELTAIDLDAAGGTDPESSWTSLGSGGLISLLRIELLAHYPLVLALPIDLDAEK